jgi:hypothetical protein
MNILYCRTPTSTCVNEALADPTLLTVHSPWSGKVTRRIKHFSGYNIAAGVDSSDADGRTASTSRQRRLAFMASSRRRHPEHAIHGLSASEATC